MGIGRKMGPSGGGGVGAVLTIDAPPGNTVTVSKDGKAKTKKANEEGVAVFKGLEGGTWTVTITDGSQTATKTVEIITHYGEEVRYRTYIVKDGVIGDIEFSGSARPSTTVVTEQDGYLNIKETGGKASGLTTSDKVNISEISSIHATINLNSAGYSASAPEHEGVSIALLSALNNAEVDDLVDAIVCFANTRTLGEQALDLDVSAVSGEYYVGFVYGSGSSKKPNFDVYDIYMVNS